jgi:Xaa-Pro aminopeptidase
MAIDSERHSRIVTMMREEELDALICSSPTEVLLLTGYWPVMGTSVAVFTAEGEVHVLVPSDEHEIAAKSSSAVLTTFNPGELYSLTTPEIAIAQPLTSVCALLSLTHARIGMERKQGIQPASYAVTASYRSALVDILRGAFPQIEIVAVDTLLEHLKASKTVIELEKMRVTANIAAAGFANMTEAIHSGLREAEIAGLLQMDFERTPLAGQMQRSYGFFYCMSGPNSATAAAAYARTRQREVQTGDLVMIHANTCGDGYWTDITRTRAAGEPSKKQVQMREAIMEARQAALDSIRPGTSAQKVDQAARNVLEKHGFGPQFKHGLGHGVGFAAANANGRPRIHPASPDVLEAGMTFNVEPAIYFDEYGGMRHCDVVAVTESGVEVLTQF